MAVASGAGLGAPLFTSVGYHGGEVRLSRRTIRTHTDKRGQVRGRDRGRLALAVALELCLIRSREKGSRDTIAFEQMGKPFGNVAVEQTGTVLGRRLRRRLGFGMRRRLGVFGRLASRKRAFRTGGCEDIFGIRGRAGLGIAQIVIRGCGGFRQRAILHVKRRDSSSADRCWRESTRAVRRIAIDGRRRRLYGRLERWNREMGMGGAEGVVVIEVDIRRSRGWRKRVGDGRDDLALSLPRHGRRRRWGQRAAVGKRERRGDLRCRSWCIVEDAATAGRGWWGRRPAWNRRAE